MSKYKFTFKKSFFLSLFIFIFFLILFILTEHRGSIYLLVKVIYALFLSVITFLIFYKGEIDLYRSIFFILTAISFIIVFKFKLWGITKNIFIAPQKGVPEVPFCHIALASNFLITLSDQIKSIFLYNWKVWGFYTLGIVYIFSTLTIGQGFCSWGCFYGGIDDGFSRLLKKPLINIKTIPQKIRDFPLGFLIFLLLSSIILFEPVYCLWFCPLKMTTAILNSKESLLVYKLQIFIFIFLGILFLIILPVLTKKRMFCSFLCPFGALQSIIGNINPYRIKIDNKKCMKCGECIKVCPVFAIDKNYNINNYCVRCGKCIDTCSKNAISFYINKDKSEFIYIVFILNAILFGGVISSFFMPKSIIVILKILKVI